MIPIRDNVPSRTAAVVTWGLIAVNAAVFLHELALDPRQLEQFFYLYGVVPARYSHAEWARLAGFPLDDYWPFVTSMFLHGGWLHLISNMWALWIFGDNVEQRMGRGRFLAFYLLTGLAAGLAHLFANIGSTDPTVGASGAIAGVLGAYFILYPHARIIVLFPILFLPLFFELPAVVYLGFWFLSQVYGGTLGGVGPQAVEAVAWWAHVGGFVAGVALHRLFLLPPGRAPRGYERDEYGIEGAWGRRH
jgi:membrane associated rhomboid family serine protease